MSRMRLLVGAGTCGEAVGAGAVREALAAEVQSQGVAIEVVATGCDGRCHANVQAWLERDGGSLAWAGVTPADAPGIVRFALGGAAPDRLGAPAGPEYPGQARFVGTAIGRCDPASLEEARARGRYRGLARAIDLGHNATIDEIDRAGLMGRGGAYFPTAIKLRGALTGGPAPRCLVVNAEEGEPGVFKDRHLVEGDPHLVLEGILVAGWAIEASTIVIYVNGEAPLMASRIGEALAAARAAGLAGSGEWQPEIMIRLGGGGYVLGEESVILESIQGDRPMPRVRPPFPTIHGLWGRPTAINNAETLANVAKIMEGGADAFRANGTERYPGTKLVAVSGDVAEPGLVEIPVGATLREVVAMAGGVRGGAGIGAVLTGGPSGLLVPPAMLDTPMEPRRAEVMLGSGNVTVLDGSRDLAPIVRSLMWFNAHESCGKCTPCREGVRRIAELLDRAATGEADPDSTRDEVLALCEIAAGASICGLGQMAPNVVRSGYERFALPWGPGGGAR